jgi:hypothetical protein
MTIVIKKAKPMTRQPQREPRGKIMPKLRAPARRKPVFGAPIGVDKAARQVTFDRSPQPLFDKILRSQFGLA